MRTGPHEAPYASADSSGLSNAAKPFSVLSTALRMLLLKSLRIYNAAGGLVRVLVERGLAAGVHETLWNGRDDRGAQMPSGPYFCRLKAGSFTSLKKMVLLK